MVKITLREGNEHIHAARRQLVLPTEDECAPSFRASGPTASSDCRPTSIKPASHQRPELSQFREGDDVHQLGFGIDEKNPVDREGDAVLE